MATGSLSYTGDSEMNQESTDLKAAVARQLQNYKPGQQDQPPSESPYQALTLEQMQLRQDFTRTPPVLVEGMIHRGTQLMIAGASKMKKTWFTMQLGMAIATGTDFLGHRTNRGKVLVVDYELMAPFLLQRVQEVARATGFSGGDNFHVMSLEKVLWDPAGLIDFLRSRDYAFISLDPLYKLMGARSENDGAEVADLLAEIDSIIHGTGATVGITHHHRKGKLSDVSPIDRASGSGMLARDPDTIINISKLDDEELGADHAQLDVTVRNFPPLDPQIIRYQYPVWHTTDLDARAFVETTKVDIIKLAALLPAHGMPLREWKEAIESKLRTKWNTAIRDAIRKEAERGRYIKNEGGLYLPTKEVIA